MQFNLIPSDDLHFSKWMNLLITHSHAHIYTLRRIETSNFKSMNISFSLHLIILQREAFTQVF